MRPHKFIRLLAALLVLLLGAAAARAQTPVTPDFDWRSRVDPVLLAASDAEPVELIIAMQPQADLSRAAALGTRLEKTAYVVQTLREFTRRTQAGALAELDRLGVPHQSYWINNSIWVRADRALLPRLASLPQVGYLHINPRVHMELPQPETGAPERLLSPEAAEWNLTKVNADDVWALGVTGQGVVIGGQDTGYQWDHPALINQYRGWDGMTADHNYNWHDAIHAPSSNSTCPPDSLVPCDDNGHGTHTMGIMVGDDGGGNQIGMAPGAEWIGCRNMDRGVGTPQTYIECYQWFLAPTDLNGTNPDPARSPDIINNSWSCPPSEDCTEPDVLLAAVENVRTAGILTVHSAGNSGPSCNSVSTPAAIYDASFTVGNTTSADTLATSSSRGPVLVDGSGRMKPDIAAPGSVIRSSYRNSTYTSLSGTSMAAPHVAGLAALLIDAQPELAGNVDALEALITHSALPLGSINTCGGVPVNTVPNNESGFGRIDALAAVQLAADADALLLLETAASPDLVTAGGVVTHTLTVRNIWGPSSATNLVLTDTLPAGLSLHSTSSPPAAQNGGTLTWELDQLGSGESWQVDLRLGTPLYGYDSLTNYALAVTSQEHPLVPGRALLTRLETGSVFYLPAIRQDH